VLIRPVKIIKNYKGKTFGFASSNFYAEFLAALEVERNAQKYFPGLIRESAWDFDEVVLGKTVRFSELVKKSGYQKEEIEKLNLAFKKPILSDRAGIVKGTLVKVPSGIGQDIVDSISGSTLHTLDAGLVATPKSAIRKQARGSSKTHKVRKGETAGSIARKYRISLKSLLRSNKLKNANKIRIGQRLKIYGSRASAKKSVKRSKGHKIRSGESLSVIARKYKVSIKSLARRNKLKKPYLLRKGAVLVIP